MTCFFLISMRAHSPDIIPSSFLLPAYPIVDSFVSLVLFVLVLLY